MVHTNMNTEQQQQFNNAYRAINKIHKAQNKSVQVDACYILVKSSHLYLYSAFNNTNCVKATAQYQNRNIFVLKAFHYLIQ